MQVERPAVARARGGREQRGAHREVHVQRALKRLAPRTDGVAVPKLGVLVEVVAARSRLCKCTQGSGAARSNAGAGWQGAGVYEEHKRYVNRSSEYGQCRMHVI